MASEARDEASRVGSRAAYGQTFAFCLEEMGRTILNRGTICLYILKGSLAAVLRIVRTEVGRGQRWKWAARGSPRGVTSGKG